MPTVGHLGPPVVDTQGVRRPTDGCSIADPHATPQAPGADVGQDFGIRGTYHAQGSDEHSNVDQSRMKTRNDDSPAPTPVDLADKVKGMYRLLDLVSESGSNGYGKGPSSQKDGFAALIRPRSR